MSTKSFKQPSVMGHNFSQIPKADIQRSTFKRDHGYKTTLDKGGILYPIFVDEVLPGDTFNVSLSSIARLSTPIVPIMDNIFMDYFFFFVPNRLTWENWQKFMGEQKSPGDSTDYAIPFITAPVGGFQNGSIYDYFGIPTEVENIKINALPIRAYAQIWQEWFRDENLQTQADGLSILDGPDAASDHFMYPRGKRHDYFTSCLPWPQKSENPVDLPLGDRAPIMGIGTSTSFPTGPTPVTETGGASVSYEGSVATTVGGAVFVEEDPDNPTWPNIYADLSNATAATINSLREAFQLQRMLERDARGGTRYTEIIRSHFSVVSPDARLQRPEYLGGGSRPVVISPVPQTTPTGIVPDVTPQGNLAAVGYQQASGIGFTKSFVEHGYIIGLCAARADLTYQQGTNRLWSRSTKYDFYWPALAHLGEQEVLNKEIYAQGTAEDDQIFGYQERWAEYRYKPSLITGKLRSNDPQSLDVWHLSQEFESLPGLNATFIEDNPPIERIIAVPSEPYFIFDAYFKCRCTRPMPMYSVPGLIDHF